MADKAQTTIVVAHRLSTLRNADRIAFVEKGKVRELGTHEELMAKENGRYRRLQSLQNLDSTSTTEAKFDSDEHEVDEHEIRTEEDVDNEEVELDKETVKTNARRAKLLAKGDGYYVLVGTVGAFLAGVVFPSWGIIFAYLINVLYYPVFPCDDGLDPPILFLPQYSTCQEYWDEIATYQRDLSFKIFYGLLGVMACSIFGNIM